ncbi:MAG: Putative glycosyltransferase, partial [uncultured Acetobacteraceae bacterium]
RGRGAAALRLVRGHRLHPPPRPAWRHPAVGGRARRASRREVGAGAGAAAGLLAGGQSDLPRAQGQLPVEPRAAERAAASGDERGPRRLAGAARGPRRAARRQPAGRVGPAARPRLAGAGAGAV